MTSLEKHLSAKGKRTETQVVEIIEAIKKLWRDGTDDSKAIVVYQEKMATFGLNSFTLSEIDRLFQKDYTEFDGLFWSWKLSDDPSLKESHKALKKIEGTGKCPFCGGEVVFRPHLNSSHCKGSCGRLFTCKSPIVLAGAQYGVNEFSAAAVQLYVN